MGKQALRADAYGECVPRIHRGFTAWLVIHPYVEKCDFSCCGQVSSRAFATWEEALAFALARSWAQ